MVGDIDNAVENPQRTTRELDNDFARCIGCVGRKAWN